MKMPVISNKETLLQDLLARIGGKRYLEVGVFAGDLFKQIPARYKVAVDPAAPFRLTPKRYLLNLWQGRTERIYRMTSDDYFNKRDIHPAFDLIFIDGLHTYEQAYRDCLGALRILRPGGVLAFHDCNPTSAAMAYPGSNYEEVRAMKLPGFTGEWCGDVWKMIVRIRSERKDLRVCVLDADYGLGVVYYAAPDSTLSLTREQIDRLSYADLEKNRREFLNLISPDRWQFEADRLALRPA